MISDATFPNEVSLCYYKKVLTWQLLSVCIQADVSGHNLIYCALYHHSYLSFHNRCTRIMCRITMARTFRCHVRLRDLRARLGIQSLDRYYYHRTLRWAGHVARMHMSRLPRKLLTGFVAHPRPTR
jgi:hypothetical protein